MPKDKLRLKNVIYEKNNKNDSNQQSENLCQELEDKIVHCLETNDKCSFLLEKLSEACIPNKDINSNQDK